MGLYVGDTYSLSFDQTTSFDSGATDHRETLKKLLEGVETLKVAWDPNVTVDKTSQKRWTTRHFVATATMSSVNVREIGGWHSAIWAQREGKWLIEYEHFRADTKLVSTPPPAPPVVLAAVPAPAPAPETFPDIFFDYDKWNIRPDQLASITVVLDYLKKYPGTEVTIEGHCDERGSTRYNINLGQKRADQTKKWLVAQGIAAERLRTISFGKSRPFEGGRSQEAWQSNRRSHFVVTKGPARP
jgi:peptidoglycan-associated lipoprotein